MSRLNDSEREMWVLKDEGLRSWWRQSKLSMRAFIRENRNELDDLIRRVVDKPASQRQPIL